MKPFRYVCLLMLLFITNLARGGEKDAYGATAMAFLENKGQVTDQYRNQRSDIDFRLNGGAGLNIYIGGGAMHYQFCKVVPANTGGRQPLLPGMPGYEPEQPAYNMYRMDVVLLGANRHAEVIRAQKEGYSERYYLPTANGVTAASYGRITYRNIYPNVDWVLYVKDGALKHEFVVHKGGSVADIKLQYNGATATAIGSDGSLQATTPMGTVREDAPYCYQQDGRRVDARFVLTGNVLSYQAANYEGDLVIDPGIIWSTYYGGAGNDRAFGNTADKRGYVYMTGVTSSASFIATTGAFQATYMGGTYDGDAFLAKFTNAGMRKWATYYGSTGEDYGYAVRVDSSGNVFMGGYTTSATGISTPGAHQPVFGGISDAMLIKFDSTGARQWATYYGGTGNDNSYSIDIDKHGNIFMGGYAGISNTGISTPGTFQPVNTLLDGYVVKFNNAGVRQWGTYYGASGGSTYVCAVATDTAGNVYGTGYTSSSTGLSSPGAYQATGGGSTDGFLVKFNANGGRLWGTYYSGSALEAALSVATDEPGNAFICGYSCSTSGIATAGAYQTTLASCGDAFLAKFTPAGGCAWATYLGGGNDESGRGVATDRKGNVYMSGYSSSTAGVATAGANQAVNGGGRDNLIAKFNTGGTIQWSTYYGSTGDETGMNICADTNGFLYLCGMTDGPGLSTAGAYQVANGGGSDDALLTRIDTCALPDPGTITGVSNLCEGATATLTATVAGGTWSASNAYATIAGGVLNGITPGVDTISYTVTNTCGTNSTIKVVTVNALPVITGTPLICGIGSTTALTSSIAGSTVTSMAPGVVSVAGVATGVSPGTATLVFTAPVTGCAASVVVTVAALPVLTSTLTPPAVCDSAVFHYTPTSAAAGATFAWTRPYAIGISLPAGSGTGDPAEALNNTTNIPIPVSYIYTVSAGGCVHYDTVQVTVAPTPVLFSPTTVTTCSGVPFVYTPFALTTSTTFAWSRAAVSGIAPATSSGTGGIAETLTNSLGMPVSVVYVYTVSLLGCDRVETVTATVGVLPDADVLTGADEVCIGQVISLSGVALGGVWSSSSGNASVSAGIVAGIAAGTATISYTFTNSCGSASATKTITVLTGGICGNGVEELAGAADGLVVYPNPSVGQFTVLLANGYAAPVRLTLTDMAGRKVYEAGGMGNKPMEVCWQGAPGIYLVCVEDGARRWRAKVILQ